MKRRIALTLAASVLLAGGCAEKAAQTPATTPSATPSAAPPASAKDKLLAAAPDESSERFRFTQKVAGTTGTGVVDVAGKRLHYTTEYKDPSVGFTMTMAFLVIDQEAWVKITFSNTQSVRGLPKLPKAWLHVDRSKVPDLKNLTSDDLDPGSAAALFGSIVDVTESTAGSYAGTLDLTKTAEAEVVEPDALTELGDKAKALPFRATVDSAGRLTAVSFDVPALGKEPAFTYETKYSDYGTAPAVEEPPADQVQEAPAEAYEFLNG
ncbi:hypothetical protein [Phytohabitans rumicis]|uniref:Lipoprotein n=1 Tax=Phytohabitans rumicis TaxID=1076125 RepID=A0A6V8L7W1_9ACTN|nr:hypothetical protein [Phytohabitans rumicis]GFJ90216.1 hypothetical protein Prum_038580 [Phytohabitans rumicis]